MKIVENAEICSLILLREGVCPRRGRDVRGYVGSVRGLSPPRPSLPRPSPEARKSVLREEKVV